MENDKTLKTHEKDLFVKHKDEITPAYQLAVRNALLKHKQAGNPVAVSHKGKVLLLQPDEIDIK